MMLLGMTGSVHGLQLRCLKLHLMLKPHLLLHKGDRLVGYGMGAGLMLD